MSKQLCSISLFGKRLREARRRMGIPQDKLGVLIGMDESCSSARISRYETGVHEPQIATVEKLAKALKVPLPYFFCEDDCMAEILIHYANLDKSQKIQLLMDVKEMSKKV
jgi:transcriptional regulator with XRE-family HTH domain